ncbi:structural maintenance of chromosomes protein 2 [Cimex lectularius]|uniref:Structural maintenance of chromosomes protein n=1 Tax=Cimex lectularius TaxID=79782 RepID=A0A8I6RUD0_CIMLE|nr:structural maintenance of chromosomes protein 2 [Cimex lectularius]
MYIKSVIIDGFKSYGTRTEINGFDREFNAITGLNGTGKSNILDSICFVLGISNLTHVRASSLQDLIYKSGQAGVTKASVTIVFDNKDTSKSPINYEQFEEITVTRQIVVAGKNRYMINGSTVTNKLVNDFFNSVQLNVNNPHFLIMQGRITKVLNMKPPEILSMIEEAAGTRMYENKKLGAQKTIEKKDNKLKEMNEMVNEQINPKMERLKKERNQYLEYQKIQRDLEQYTRIYVAWQVVKTEKFITDSKEQRENTLAKIEEAKKTIEDGKNTIKQLEESIEEGQQKRNKESGGKLEELESKLREVEKFEAIALGKIKSGDQTVKAEKVKCKELEKNLKDDENMLAAKQAELDSVQSVFDTLRETEKRDAEALAAAQDKYQKVSSGLLSSEDGKNATLQEQLMTVKKHVSEKETEMKQCSVEIKSLKTELNNKKPLLKKTEMTFSQDKKNLEVNEKELKVLQANLNKLNYEDGKLESLQDSLKTLDREMRQCQNAVSNFNASFPQLHFKYRDPEPNFDRRKVKGLLCKLFKVKEERFARALEIAAGGKLYNVVVDNELVSSKLIEKGELTRRTTFAPLNKIQGRRFDPNIFQRAEALVGKGNVFPAQTLIEYNPEYEPVMSWAFGQVLVCTTIDAAEKVSCHRDVRRKAITIDGDVFDPSGVVSGGAAEKSQPILLSLMEIMQTEKTLQRKTQEYEKLNKQIQQLMPIASNFDNLKQKFDLRTREIEMLRQRLQQTSHYQLQQELEAIQQSISEKEEIIEECKKELAVKTAKVIELENKLQNLKSIKEKELKSAEAEMKKIKQKSEDSRKQWRQREQEFETLKLVIQELTTSVQTGKEEVLKCQESIKNEQDNTKSLSEELTKTQESVKEMKAKVKAQKDAIGQKNKEIQQMISQKEKLNKMLGEKELECIKEGHAITTLDEKISSAHDYKKNLSKQYKWIKEDREYFGEPNGMYDFNANDPEEAKKKIDQLKEAQEKIGKHVNTKAMDLLSTQEEQFQDVMTKKGIIEEDRSKILDVIGELDLKKREVIQNAWERVNHDFNSILSFLLPSAHAKLKPVDGKDMMDGLEVKVGFGGIWKDSLDELSGGQRSLVALSLILAMLLFKPAPLYILDEVDAALDPSHTQNIGQMLKAHFKQSQFIVVSLKDGMFNNANVLFRTSFVDGMSAVIRTTNKK